MAIEVRQKGTGVYVKNTGDRPVRFAISPAMNNGSERILLGPGEEKEVLNFYYVEEVRPPEQLLCRSCEFMWPAKNRVCPSCGEELGPEPR